jgi:hypothetical protein
VSLDALRELRASGTLLPADMVWRNGMSGWVRAQDAPELSDIASPAPAAASASASMAPGALSYQTFPHTGEVAFTGRAFDMLRQTKPWVRLMSIVMFVVAGLTLVFGIVIGIGGMMSSGVRSAGIPAALGFVYIAMGLLYLAPGIYLFRYASRIALLVATRREDALEGALESQKSFWKFAGIITLVVIGLYVLIFAAAMVIALLR